MGKRTIRRSIEWPIGLSFDAFRYIAEAKGIKLIDRSIQDWDKVEDQLKDDLVVRWKLSNGQKVTFERGRGVDGKGALRYRITKVENRERNVRAKKNHRTKPTH